MKYEKPEIRFLGAAVSSIQNPSQKGTGGPQDHSNPTTYVSQFAYEVDE
jgi:hypothetical protein